MRIAVAYKASPYTTANYMVTALGRAGHEVRCVGLGHAPQGDFASDAFLWIEAGGGRPEWLDVPAGIPTAGWFIDSHSQAWHKDLAGAFDRAYSAQRTDWASWLPVACDPETHTPDAGIAPEHDVVFVGHLYAGSALYETRRVVLDRLARRYDLAVYEGVYGHAMANALARGRVVFNISAMGDLNMRVFEGLCSGRCVVTDACEGVEALFTDGVHLLMYRDEGELYRQIEGALARPAWAAQIGAAGRAAVLAQHTYDHRAQVILGGVAA